MGRAVVCPDVARRLNSAQPALTLAPFTLFFAVSLVMSGGHVNSLTGLNSEWCTGGNIVNDQEARDA